MATFGWGPNLRGSRSSDSNREFSSGGASHLIRSAEKLASSGRYNHAIEQLTVAQRLDPDNKYIQAIIDRIQMVQNSIQEEARTQGADDASSSPLAVTVGRNFATGIKSKEDEPVLSPDDIHTRVRFLTNMAEQYLERGSSEQAFDSLMNAYLLDPLSPYVIASEKSVLPAWESARTRIVSRSDDRSFTNEPVMTTSTVGSIGTPLGGRPMQHGSPGQTNDEQLRMELLKQQKEQERIEKERSVWRDASKPPKIFGEEDSVTSPDETQAASDPKKVPSTGLFSKLRLGKFLE